MKGQNCSTLPSVLFISAMIEWLNEWRDKTVVRYQVFCSSAQWLNDWMIEWMKGQNCSTLPSVLFISAMIEWLNEWRDKTSTLPSVLFISAMIEWLNEWITKCFDHQRNDWMIEWMKGQNCSTLPSVLFISAMIEWLNELNEWRDKTVVRYQVFCSSAQWLNDWMNEGTKL